MKYLQVILVVLVLGLVGCSNAQKEGVKEAVCGPEEPCPECRACPMCPRLPLPPLPSPLPPMSQIDRLEHMQYLRQRIESELESVRRNEEKAHRASCRLSGWSEFGDCSKRI